MSVDIQALRDAQSRGLTVGVVPTTGKPALRLEIDDFIQDTELANLYFLALEAFQSKGVNNKPFSYHEISGIHGQPYRAWDGVNSADFERTGSTNRTSGYCSHGSVIFPTWHRAYLAMFEQGLFLHAAEIAPRLGAEAVLDRFRIPYFDPFLPRQKAVNGDAYTYGIPVIMTLPEILLRRPERPDAWTPSRNPLYQFNFPETKERAYDFSRYKNWGIEAGTEHTIRGLYTTAGLSQHERVMQTFDNVYNPWNGLSSQSPINLWRVMFDSSQDWIQMSNHFDPRTRRANPRPTYNANSLEGFHDNIHGELGGPGGHMSFPEFAGFDPAFWMHHCNVDRLLSIWQGIHSQDSDSVAWWSSLDVPFGNFVEPANQHETPDTPLAPFRKSVGSSGTQWWTSNDVRDHTKLGYDYPQTAAASESSNYVGSLIAWANQSLGWLSPSRRNRTGPDPEAVADFGVSTRKRIPFFPDPVLVDGRTRAFDDKQIIGSLAPKQRTAPTRAFAAALSHNVKKAPEKSEPALKPEDGEEIKPEAEEAKPEKTLVEPTKPEGDEVPEEVQVRTAALTRAIPAVRPPIEERFGDCCGVIDDHKMTQWSVSFSVDKFALDGTFKIYFFLGDFTENQADWIFDEDLVGSSTIFASSRERIDQGNCENCKKQEESGLKYADTLSLTQALLVYYHSQEESYGLRVADMTPEVILPFLTRNLHWRIVDARDDEAPRETVESLRVMVYSETVHLPHSITDKPTFHDPTVHYSVTNGRPGGLNEGGGI
ncbi:Tyrosinase [Zalerion maritima]|uniref:tyrosinase n=1 Tax=Zalerion maritima TaxID=339359 RepID=A0AAD5RIJ0_9PEZI|nr:Tyrosinase [Zalerion maritima]